MVQKEFTIRIKCESEATQLWVELLRIINNDPYIAANENDMAWYRCYFCKSDFDREHNEDCIYIRAKKMLEKIENSEKKFVKAENE